ncbi:Uncharacterised protein [uncultured archaeon]|nr:Uncharacterised protein [uncultured archaeon]
MVGGDRRAIAFLGSCPSLEEELYSGQIRNDQELLARARELGASLQVSDGREKVWRSGDVLVGEVAEISLHLERRRRVYLVPGLHLIVDISGGEAMITGRGRAGCIILGNRFTQRLAGEEIGRANGRVNEQLIKSILEKAGEMTASVSQEHTVLKCNATMPDPEKALLSALKEDCKKSGWRLCGPQ